MKHKTIRTLYMLVTIGNVAVIVGAIVAIVSKVI